MRNLSLTTLTLLLVAAVHCPGQALTKYLVELHGGRIWFESVYGEGTTFYVALPAGDE